MRAIHLARLDKLRPVVILTRDIAIPHLRRVSVAPITSRVHGIAVEVPVGPENGLDQSCVINCDNIETVEKTDIGRHLGYLLQRQEEALTEAVMAAFDLT